MQEAAAAGLEPLAEDGPGVVIAGAGQAGLSLAEGLRKGGYGGKITLLGAEPEPPYQRPPLSKAYLLGEMARERLFLKPPAALAELGITLQLGDPVTAIDRKARMVETAAGRRIPYDRLALTLGARPRLWPEAAGGMLPGTHVIRSLADIDALRPALVAGTPALVIGGGYIGLEAAAVLRKAGLPVTLVEAAPRILARVAAPETADYFRTLHTGHGVDLREGCGVERLVVSGTSDGGKSDGANTNGARAVAGARLSTGDTIPAQLVIVGIGVTPETALAEAAGLALENGIAVDALGRTSDPRIVAAGDCASFPHAGGRLRLESVPNAIDHATAVAASLLGDPTPYTPRPWFWSDQFDVKLQIAGLLTGYDRVVERPGEKAGARSIWYFAADRLLAVDAMNAPRDYLMGKRWIEGGLSPDPAALVDPSQPIKTIPVHPCALSAAG